MMSASVQRTAAQAAERDQDLRIFVESLGLGLCEQQVEGVVAFLAKPWLHEAWGRRGEGGGRGGMEVGEGVAGREVSWLEGVKGVKGVWVAGGDRGPREEGEEGGRGGGGVEGEGRKEMDEDGKDGGRGAGVHNVPGDSHGVGRGGAGGGEAGGEVEGGKREGGGGAWQARMMREEAEQRLRRAYKVEAEAKERVLEVSGTRDEIREGWKVDLGKMGEVQSRIEILNNRLCAERLARIKGSRS